jgi:hypothetical protein
MSGPVLGPAFRRAIPAGMPCPMHKMPTRGRETTSTMHDAQARLTAPPLIAIITLALAACGSMPEQKIVAHATSLPPVSVAVPVSCVKKMPDPPTVIIDGATLKQRYYQMRAAIEELDRWYVESRIILQSCATEAPAP